MTSRHTRHHNIVSEQDSQTAAYCKCLTLSLFLILTHPVAHVEEALLAGEVKHEQETHGVSEEGCGEAPESAKHMNNRDTLWRDHTITITTHSHCGGSTHYISWHKCYSHSCVHECIWIRCMYSAIPFHDLWWIVLFQTDLHIKSVMYRPLQCQFLGYCWVTSLKNCSIKKWTYAPTRPQVVRRDTYFGIQKNELTGLEGFQGITQNTPVT